MTNTTAPDKSLSATKVSNVDLQLCFALYSASLSMTKTYKPLLSKLKLTYPQYLVLLVLWEKDGMTVNSISERLFSDSGTLTPLLKRLEKLGMIQRQRAREDERKVIITLTEAGRLLQTESTNVHSQIACSTGCTITELQALNNQLIMLRTNLIKNLNTV
ncbi:MarR family transcriptional regulator [Methylotenera oryzisoli]|uniref:HTH-type transcriptional regulator SarZ n=1 Tax=Methylotenera oryzisoli TaxID=2080758 RepID=A0A4Y9VUC7_9PROT|nr:MarR family transcriptional regulator [Methylotenera oryzisoli]TFW72277.1 MarR family transcriptional regulator [Methylotenera oryzisoli]